jgi:hypothetical protein
MGDVTIVALTKLIPTAAVASVPAAEIDGMYAKMQNITKYS